MTAITAEHPAEVIQYLGDTIRRLLDTINAAEEANDVTEISPDAVDQGICALALIEYKED